MRDNFLSSFNLVQQKTKLNFLKSPPFDRIFVVLIKSEEHFVSLFFLVLASLTKVSLIFFLQINSIRILAVRDIQQVLVILAPAIIQLHISPKILTDFLHQSCYRQDSTSDTKCQWQKTSSSLLYTNSDNQKLQNEPLVMMFHLYPFVYIHFHRKPLARVFQGVSEIPDLCPDKKMHHWFCSLCQNLTADEDKTCNSSTFFVSWNSFL